MLALTLTEPWATLSALEAKRYETRSWQRNYRGQLAIHAAAGLASIGGTRGLRALCGTQPFFDALMVIVPNYNRYCDADAIVEVLLRTLGKIIAVGFKGDCRAIELPVQGRMWTTMETALNPTTLSDQERAFGDYTPGRWAWPLTNMQRLRDPIPAKGALGLWQPDEATLAAVQCQLIASVAI